MRKSSSIRAATALTCRSSRFMSLAAADRTCLSIGQHAVDSEDVCGRLRSFHVAKTRAFDLDLRIAFLCGIDNFLANVLSFTITIGPDDEKTGVLGLVCYVLRNVLFILLLVSVRVRKSPSPDYTHIVYVGNHRSTEQRLWRRKAPVFVLAGKVQVGEMAHDAGHRDGALTILRAEIEIKRVILDVLISGAML